METWRSLVSQHCSYDALMFGTTCHLYLSTGGGAFAGLYTFFVMSDFWLQANISFVAQQPPPLHGGAVCPSLVGVQWFVYKGGIGKEW